MSQVSVPGKSGGTRMREGSDHPDESSENSEEARPDDGRRPLGEDLERTDQSSRRREPIDGAVLDSGRSNETLATPPLTESPEHNDAIQIGVQSGQARLQFYGLPVYAVGQVITEQVALLSEDGLETAPRAEMLLAECLTIAESSREAHGEEPLSSDDVRYIR